MATVELVPTVYERMAEKKTKKVATLVAEQPTTALAVIEKPTEDRLDTLTRTIREAHADAPRRRGPPWRLPTGRGAPSSRRRGP